jgi:uncharacterized membrane protein
MKNSHKIGLFIVYFALFLTIFAMIDYYAYDFITFSFLLILSFFIALVTTYVHAKNHEKSKVDELAQDIEDIL